MSDPFAALGRLPADPAARLEDYACRRALKVAGIPAGRARRFAAGPAFTFADLAGVDFPLSPVVTSTTGDPIRAVLGKFPKTDLWAAWVAAWDLNPGTRPGRRALVFRGPDWGLAVLHDQPPAARDHLRVGAAVGLALAAEPFTAWVGGLAWADDGGR